MIGISKLVPEDSNWFQRRCAKEIPRSTSPIYNELTEGDLVDHTCIAIRKDLFFKIGMENEALIRGTDPDLRHRIRNAGYKIAIAPNSWGYHPMPKSLGILLKMFFRNGMGSSWVQRHYSELAFHDSEDHTTPFEARTSPQFRMLNFLLGLAKSLGCCHFFYFIARAGYALGFVYGVLSGKSGDHWYDKTRAENR